MELQSQLVVGGMLVVLVGWIFWCFTKHKLAAGQVLFWLTLMLGALVFTVSPPLVDWLSVLWGDLVPVSWITFLGLLSLIAYLLYQSIKLNQLRSRYLELARTMAFLEQRLRKKETGGEHGP